MICSRKLNRKEIQQILLEAPIEETRNLINFLKKYNLDAFDFFTKKSIYSFGLVSNGRPIYFAYIIPSGNGIYELWTVVNSNVKEQFSLYKYSKKSILEALKSFSPIYATMEKINDKNMKWVERLGFSKIFDDGNIVRFMIK